MIFLYATCPVCTVHWRVAAADGAWPTDGECEHPYVEEFAAWQPQYKTSGPLEWDIALSSATAEWQIQAPPQSLQGWPDNHGATCDMPGCDELALTHLPLCRTHAAVVPLEFLHAAFEAAEWPITGRRRQQHRDFNRAYAVVRRFADTEAAEAEAIING